MARGHDPRWKELIRELPLELLGIVDPDLAARIERGPLELLPTEVFAGGPRGRALRVDLAAAVRESGEPGARAVIHVEIELRYRSGQETRFFLYNRLLVQREGSPVLTIVLYLHGGPPGLRLSEHVERAMGEEVCRFRYRSFGLSRLPAEDYLARPEPLAWVLAALMRPGSGDRRALRRACLAQIAGEPDLSDSLRFRLFECVANYLELDGGAEEEFEALLPAEAGEETRKMARTLRQALIEEGMQRGIREVLRRQLERRFGPLSQRVSSQLAAIRSTEELEGLAERVIQARSLAELGL